MTFVGDSNSPALQKKTIAMETQPASQKKASLRIDRVTLLIDLHPADTEAALNHLISVKLNGGAEGIVPAGSKAKSGSMVAFHVKVPTSTSPLIWSIDNAATVQLKQGKGGKLQIRIEIFPLGLTTAGFEHLYDEIFCGAMVLHSSDILKARVSRIDLALDLHGVRLQDFAWHMPQRNVIRHYVSKRGLETIYLGSPKHGAACIYDKAAQQKLPASEAWTRLELRPKPNTPLWQLPDLANPFGALTPYDVATAFSVVNVGEICRKAALSHAQLLGIRSLVAMVPDVKAPGSPKSARQRFTDALAASVPKWWASADIWALWPNALATAMAGLFD
ncbi:hypothetical protein [Falsiroseomonas ponticola]|uniref:hypothetical protein n=1 Tax=Falsiroseomonas ponticola TaxID=2786951 RepID=UPI001931776C|nr:hypothetical protein [Roseomonas ponticola]